MPFKAFPKCHKQVISQTTECLISIIKRAETQTLLKGLLIISGLFRAHPDEKYIYEILIKPSFSTIPKGMQFRK